MGVEWFDLYGEIILEYGFDKLNAISAVVMCRFCYNSFMKHLHGVGGADAGSKECVVHVCLSDMGF